MSSEAAPSSFEFYLVVAPGLEELAARELKAWAPDLSFESGRGGITLHTDLARGLGLNHCLKIPTRILLRVADYGCRDFPKLFKKMSNFEWSKWIADDRVVEFKAASHASRLFHKKRIEETCLDGRKAYLKKKGLVLPTNGEPITVYVRLQDDVCFVSLDTSGERLHKRGTRELSSDAPLRESIAAALLWYMEVAAPSKSVGLGVELVDPMCGAGTFFLEASGLKKPIASREFAYATWGGTDVRTATIPSAIDANDPYRSFKGFEIDPKTAAAARKNWQSIEESRSFEIIEGDFFEAKRLEGDVPRWLVCNPPYGERIDVGGKISQYYERMFEAVAEKIRPERACFLLPDKARPNDLRLPKGWKKVSSLRLSNGGLPVTALLVRT